jgi:hypothetical protein
VSVGDCCWQRAVIAIALVGMVFGLPSAVNAQRTVRSGLAPSTAAAFRLPPRSVTSAASARGGDSVSRPFAVQVPDAPRRARGPTALRGLVVGAVVGGAVGYFFGRHEEYGGAVGGPLVGAAIGAPIGMLVLLLATPT